MNKLLIIAALFAAGSTNAHADESLYSPNTRPVCNMQTGVEVQEVSVTRNTYLEKMQILERQLADIDLKWNWVVSVPSEDSIAKAEGWYTFMENRKKELHTEVVRVKLEQLINYYNDILKFPETEQTIQIKLIPEMQASRKTLAPAYPDHLGYIPATETETAALEKWIMNFPDQYAALTSSLESLVISYL